MRPHNKTLAELRKDAVAALGLMAVIVLGAFIWSLLQ
jgi:hypothetical protein